MANNPEEETKPSEGEGATAAGMVEAVTQDVELIAERVMDTAFDAVEAVGRKLRARPRPTTKARKPKPKAKAPKPKAKTSKAHKAKPAKAAKAARAKPRKAAKPSKGRKAKRKR